MGIRQWAKELKMKTAAVYLAFKYKETPVLAKILAGITIGYALSPIDLIPDFIPVLGYLDDIIVLPLFLSLSIRLIPPEIMEACMLEAADLWQDGKPKRWYYAVPIVLIWSFIIGLIIWHFVF